MAYGSNTREFKLTVTEVDAYSVEVYWSQRSVIRNGSTYTVGVLQEKTSTVNKNRCRVSFINRYNSTDQEDTVAIYHNNELIGIGVDELNITDDNVAVSAADAYDIFKLLIPSTAGDTGGGSTDPITISWPDFLMAHAGGTLTPYRTYAISAPDGFGGATLFVNSIGGGTIDTKATLYDIFGSLFKALQVDLAVVDGAFASYIYNRFYDPVANNVWYGHPDQHGTDGRAFFDAMMAQSNGGDYSSMVVASDAIFSGGYPTSANNFTFNNGTFNFPDTTTVSVANGYTANGLTFTFSSNSSVENGIVGGRGCSAELSTVVDLGGSGVIDLSTIPLCKSITMTNVASGGLTNIIEWNTPENHGAEILIIGATPFTVSASFNTSPLVGLITGGTDYVGAQWIKVLLNHDGTPYIIDIF